MKRLTSVHMAAMHECCQSLRWDGHPVWKIVAFHLESDSIKAYHECVQLYFVANKTPEDVQVPILLSCTGVPTYSLLSDLLAPSAPSSKSLQVNSEALCNHFEPKQVVIAQHFYTFTKAISQRVRALLTMMPS